jgi:hypothetical protein
MNSMSPDNLAKYVLAVIGFGSLFALVVLGKIEAASYVDMLLPGLAALGVHAIATGTTKPPQG